MKLTIIPNFRHYNYEQLNSQKNKLKVMTIPIHIPPEEIVVAIEGQLNATFLHFIVSKQGVVEGLFEDNETKEHLTVVFEAKREMLNIEGELDMALEEMDNNALEAMRTMLETMIDDVESKLYKELKQDPIIEIDMKGTLPTEYDDWFCP
jgi:hypothetical protein|tara:strand:+ start:307 stop:756 length:450 start_codon:yes stop_codon:yes gene_type:complete